MYENLYHFCTVAIIIIIIIIRFVAIIDENKIAENAEAWDVAEKYMTCAN